MDCQADGLGHLPTRFVIPLLVPADVPRPIARLNPLVTLDGSVLLVATHFAAAVPVRELGDRVASLADEQDRIVAAIDFLLSGF
ncbi:CcdB family protein [Sphingomonas sp. Leaf25]|uniref:CcdB family protein n=1 Tax=Sphingomonas sp. Leaf25 TaxID=1735692 RepID=UPI001F1F6D6F|nr:CcdB family protein [Sphingomonas sp. Leaf25]